MDQHFNSAGSIDTETVTVVIPTYNRMPFIKEAVDSVIAQTYRHWELFIVDDGSTDDTVAALNAINDPRIHIINLQHQGTTRGLRNMGIRTGKGKWVSFLDSDDTWLPQKLEFQLAALHQTGYECCYSNFELTDEKGNIIPAKAGFFQPLTGNIIRQLITTKATVTIDSLLLSRKLFDELNGFSEDPKLMREDYEFELRLALRTKMVSVPQVLVHVREHRGRMTNTFSVADAHLHSALPYAFFVKQQPGKALAALANKRYRQHMRIAAKNNFRAGNYAAAFYQIKKAIAGTR